MASRVAIVTGANKGIGFAIVRGLCKRFNGSVYLTSRDVVRGREAVSKLEEEGLQPYYHQLDITDAKSIETLRDHIKEIHGGIDILVNNAAIAFKHAATEPVAEQAKQTIYVNYFSLLTTCDILFPILNNGARVVNISSSAGHLSRIPGESIRNKLKDPKLTIEQLSNLMEEYVSAAQNNTHTAEWGDSSYVVSKVGLSALTRIQQKLLNDRDIKVNAVHPGYVDTDMTSHKGPLSIDEGASAPLYLALDAPDDIRGLYLWCDTKVVDWEGDKTPE